MKLISTWILYAVDSAAINNLNQTSNNTSEYVSTGGIHPAYFLGTVLFIIFIMTVLLLIKILNLKHSEISGNKNNKQ